MLFLYAMMLVISFIFIYTLMKTMELLVKSKNQATYMQFRNGTIISFLLLVTFFSSCSIIKRNTWGLLSAGNIIFR